MYERTNLMNESLSFPELLSHIICSGDDTTVLGTSLMKEYDLNDFNIQIKNLDLAMPYISTVFDYSGTLNITNLKAKKKKFRYIESSFY